MRGEGWRGEGSRVRGVDVWSVWFGVWGLMCDVSGARFRG